MNALSHVRVWLGALLALVFLVPVVLTPSEATQRVQREAAWAEETFGAERYDKVATRANGAYKVVVVDTGLRRFIDSGYTDDSVRGTESFGGRQRRSFAGVFNGYVHALSVQLYGFFFRGFIMLEWLTFVGLFLVGAIVDGVARRRVKMATGGFNSPVKYTWAMHTMIMILFSPFMYLLLPMAITPLFMPYWVLAIALPLTVAMSNAVRVG